MPLTMEHAPSLYRLTSQESVSRYMRFTTHVSPRQAEELCEELMKPGCYAFWVCEKETQEPVGVFSLKKEDGETGCYSLSAFQAPESWNKGYNGELLRRFCAYAKSQLGARALTAYVVGENSASRRSLEKHGFHVVETLRFADCPSGLLIYRLELSPLLPNRAGGMQ